MNTYIYNNITIRVQVHADVYTVKIFIPQKCLKLNAIATRLIMVLAISSKYIFTY